METWASSATIAVGDEVVNVPGAEGQEGKRSARAHRTETASASAAPIPSCRNDVKSTRAAFARHTEEWVEGRGIAPRPGSWSTVPFTNEDLTNEDDND
jgi:hypothetical protein